MRNRAVLAYVGMLAVSFAGVFAWISGSSFVLQEIYGLSALSFGLAFAAASGGYLAGTALATRIVIAARARPHHRHRRGRACVGGLGAVAAIPLGGASPIPLIAAMALYAVGMGLVQPQTDRGRHDAVPASRRHRVVAARRLADGVRGGERRDRRTSARHERLAGRDPARADRMRHAAVVGGFARRARTRRPAWLAPPEDILEAVV